MDENKVNNSALKRWLLLIAQGAVVGVGAILPGVSGGTLCVIFNMYRPLIELLASPREGIKKYARLFLPFGLGWAVGFVALARVVELLFKNAYNVATCLFIGLIVGMLPQLLRERKRDGLTAGANVALALCTVLMLGFFMFLSRNEAISITPSWGWFLFCGAMWGISLIVPGMSSSSLLIFLGLYYPMTAGIADLDLGVILPMLLGIAASALALARGVDRIMREHYGVAMSCIVGFVIASTIPIIPTAYASMGEGLLCLLCAVAGAAFALWMARLEHKYGAVKQ